MLNLVDHLLQVFKLRLPKFLVPRRKYELDESMWLVKSGRTQVATLHRRVPQLMKIERYTLTGFTFGTRKLDTLVGSVGPALRNGARKVALVLQWGRVPKNWELSFVKSMESMEAQGIPFAEVIRTDLPSIIGEAPAEVLLRWVGRGGRSQPRRFVKAVNKMFGNSGKRIVTGLESNLDPKKLLDARKEPEQPFQSVIDAINEADTFEYIPYERKNKGYSSHA